MCSAPLPTKPHVRREAVIAVLFSAVLLLGCGPRPAPPSARVYFVAPNAGTPVTSPVLVVFGVDNLELGAVPENVWSSQRRLSIDSRLVEVVTPREGIVHHHLGIDTDCLAPDTIVPQAAPWIDFSDAASEVGLELPPGKHTLVLQAGDDEHRTIDGLCTAVTITVVG